MRPQFVRGWQRFAAYFAVQVASVQLPNSFVSEESQEFAFGWRWRSGLPRTYDGGAVVSVLGPHVVHEEVSPRELFLANVTFEV